MALFALLGAARLLMGVSVALAGTAKPAATGGLPLCGHGGTTKGPVSPWRMGALQFVSPAQGIGLTASTLICYEHRKTGSQVDFRSQPVRLALTSDGGRLWRLAGTPVPAGSATPMTSGEQLVAAGNRVWAIVDNGRLLATTDQGHRWRRVRLSGRAVQLALRDAHIWSVTCVKVKSRAWPSACRPELWRAPIGTGAWTQVPLPKLTAQDPDLGLAIASEQNIALDC